MLLSDTDICQARVDGKLDIVPWADSLLQPASYDVRLDATFLIFDGGSLTHIDPKKTVPMKGVTIPRGREFVLHPGEFALGSTVERVHLGPSIAARLEGKSSLGRLGLLTHATAGFIDPGFRGTITLELANVANVPILLYPGMKIGQLCFNTMLSASTKPYGHEKNNYQNQKGPTPSRSFRQFDDAGV